MSTNEVVVALQNKAKESKVFKDVALMFASRQRTRFVITMGGLKQRMDKEGFSYDANDYAQILKFLAGLGLGKLETNANGRVKALKDVRLTLQSIGQAAIGDKPILKGFRRRNTFQALPVKSTSFEIVMPKAVQSNPVSLTVSINGKNIVVPIPKDLTANEIAALVTKLEF